MLLRNAPRWGALAIVAIFVATTASTTLATPAASHRASPASHPNAASLTARQKFLSQVKVQKRSGGTRGTVNVRELAKQTPTARPVGKLPRETRATSVPKAAPGSKAPLVLGPPLPTAATTNADGPAAQTPFTGLAESSGPLTSGGPPDPWVAVGPEHIIQAVNLTLKVTDRQGGSPTSVSLPDFFNLPTLVTTYDSDPHVIYDSLHHRWLATEVSWDCDTTTSTVGNGYIDYAVSETADPLGVWDISGVYFQDIVPDYPAPGTSTDKIAFSSNDYTMTACSANPTLAFLGTEIDYVDWAAMHAGATPSIFGLAFNEFTFTPRAAVQAPATTSAMQHVFIGDPGSGDQDVIYFTEVGSVEAGTMAFGAFWDLTFNNVVAPALDPPQPHQTGADTIANAVDSRFTDAVWQGNRLVLVSTYPCESATHDCVRVTEINTTGASATVKPTLTQDFLVAETGKDLYMGGVGLSGNGALHVAWTRSSDTDSPSSYTAHLARGDALNSISAPELLAAGTGAYAGERWGDYVGMAQDPQVPNQVWNANEYSGTTEWLTKVTPLRTAGTTYFPITPTRVLDTRIGLGTTTLTMGTAKSWAVAGVGVIPANAVAVTGNVTVTGQQAAGYVSITVDPISLPPSSTINFPLGDTRANNVTIPLSATGKLSAVFRAGAGKKTNLVFDVTGYFLADDTGAFFNPITTPVRVIDTRIDLGFTGKSSANVARTLILAGTNGIPLTATAITGNLTVVKPSRAGYVSVTKTPTATPATSTINFPVSAVRANGVFAPLDPLTGALSIVFRAGGAGTVDILLDVTGYFDPTPGGLHFVPLNPSRILDSRGTTIGSGLNGKFVSTVPRTLVVQGHWGVPLAATVVTGNLTVVGQTSAGYVSVTPLPIVIPPTSTINFPIGDTMANGVVAPLDTGNTSFVYRAGALKTTDLILDLSGYFEP